MKQWRCIVCGYIHTGDEPPETCPVCGAPKSKFELIQEDDKIDVLEEKSPAPSGKPGEGQEASDRSWDCQVCGYQYKGGQPPDKCPVCQAPKERFESKEIDAIPEEPQDAGTPDPKVREPDTLHSLGRTIKPVSQLVAKADLLTRLHGHPIAVHIPNGVLPVVVCFTLLAMLFKYEPLAVAAKLNCIFVAVSMPVVLITGFVDWFNRFGGHLTSIFKIKIACGVIVSALTLVLALMWAADPQIYLGGKMSSTIFIVINLVDLATAAVAGFYGGKLVFRD